MMGLNFVSMIGKVVRPDFKEYESGVKLFKGQLAIPTTNPKVNQYVKISCWGDLGELLYSQLSIGAVFKIHGHLEESSFESNCTYCNSKVKKYITEVIVDNFIKIEEN